MTITLVNDTISDICENSIANLSGCSNNEELFPTEMGRKNNNYDLNNINRIDIFKDLIINQEERINQLKEEIKFLRDDSANKLIIINNLIEITKTLPIKIMNGYNSNNISTDDKSNNGRRNIQENTS